MKLLKKPKSKHHADQAREMGLRVGDRIIGRVEYDDTWHEVMLEIVFIGDRCLICLEWRRNKLAGCAPLEEWSDPVETCQWTLDCRQWALVEPCDVAPDGRKGI